MKATLRFTLPEEHDEHRAATEATALVTVIQRVDERLRRRGKDDSGQLTVEAARDILREELDARELWWVLG